MKSLLKRFFPLILSLFLGACALPGLYYLGFHGPSIRAYPDFHEEVTEDRECLECHSPENYPDVPQTSHPNFHGCLKCHNDEIPADRKN